MVSTLASVLGGTINDKNNMKSSMARKDSVSTWFVLPRNTLKVRVLETKSETQELVPGYIKWGDVSGYPDWWNSGLWGGNIPLIWGHPTYGIWGEEYWATEETFILGHPNLGVLGSNVLGGTLPSFVDDGVVPFEDSQITIEGAKQLQNFLSDETSYFPDTIVWGDGTTPFARTSTAMPNILGSAAITSSLVGTSLVMSSEIYSTTIGTSSGTATQMGLVNSSNDVLYFYSTLQEPLIMDNNSNYRFDVSMSFETDGGSRNVWTNEGTSFMAETFGGTAHSTPNFYGFGIGTSDVSVTSTSLEGEFLRNEVTAFSNSDYLISTLYTTVELDDGVGTAISRGGLWSGGTADGDARLLTEDKFSTINKTALFSIDLEYKNLIN